MEVAVRTFLATTAAMLCLAQTMAWMAERQKSRLCTVFRCMDRASYEPVFRSLNRWGWVHWIGTRSRLPIILWTALFVVVHYL